MNSAREIVEDVLSPSRAREIWTGNFEKVWPISVQHFDLSAVFPAVFYMFRFGHRRGRGEFSKTFGPSAEASNGGRRITTIEQVGRKLAQNETFLGFDSDVEQGILGDLLLCYCLENIRHELGRTRQVQRVAPTHFMASWVDLPTEVAHLRHVPEMIVAMLADQKGDEIQPGDGKDKTWFAAGKGYEENVLLRAFSQGVERRGELSSLTADKFKENDDGVGLDQLLMVRLAQQLGSAPQKLRGREGSGIPNQHPIAEKAVRHFSEDIRRFVRSYANVIPRQTFVELLESCTAVGVTTILSSTVEILFEWAHTGSVPECHRQDPMGLFVDCSNGANRELRMHAEAAMDNFMRYVARLPVLLMILRLLDREARYDRKIKKIAIKTRPYSTAWINLLGELLHERREEARPIHRDLDRITAELAERLEEDYSEVAEVLGNDENQPNPIWRLAEGLTSLMGRANKHVNEMVDSSLHLGRPNGLAKKRTIIRSTRYSAGGRRTRDMRSIVFSDAVLDYLVHLHLLPRGQKPGIRAFSFRDFLDGIQTRYGFYVDVAPPGMAVPAEILLNNRQVLERRLRDLGLFVGVNDSEAMKCLQPRFRLV